MKFSVVTAGSTIAGLLIVGTAVVQVQAGPDLVKFPDAYENGVRYGVVSNPNNKLFREFYTTKNAVEAVQSGKPIPSGTWIVMKSFKAKLDPTGAPEKGSDGHFVKDGLAAYAVMEKRVGWGTEYPDALRNGEWEYQAFTPAKAVNDKANIKACFECHKPKDGDDFLFTLNQMKAHK